MSRRAPSREKPRGCRQGCGGWWYPKQPADRELKAHGSDQDQGRSCSTHSRDDADEGQFSQDALEDPCTGPTQAKEGADLQPPGSDRGEGAVDEEDEADG